MEIMQRTTNVQFSLPRFDVKLLQSYLAKLTVGYKIKRHDPIEEANIRNKHFELIKVNGIRTDRDFYGTQLQLFQLGPSEQINFMHPDIKVQS